MGMALLKMGLFTITFQKFLSLERRKIYENQSLYVPIYHRYGNQHGVGCMRTSSHTSANDGADPASCNGGTNPSGSSAYRSPCDH
jgi:hypothetical protein